MADTQPYRPKKRGFETAGDMLRSLVPILVLVLGFAYFCIPKGESKINTIDPAVDIKSMAEYSDIEVAAPTALNKTWKPTSSSLLRDGDAQTGTPIGLTIGYVTPKQKFARFTIRQGERADVLKLSVDDAEVTKDPAGKSLQIGTHTWTPIETNAGRGYVSLTGEGAASIVIVLAGGASYAELREFAGALEPVAKTD